MGDLLALLVLDQRQDAEHRQVELALDLFGALEGVVEHLQQQGDADAGHQGEDAGQGDDQALLRLDRQGGNHGLVDHAGVGAFQVGGGGGFLQTGHEGVVQGAVGIHLALQFAQLEFLARNVLDLRLVGVERGLQRAFVGDGQLIVALDTGDDLLDLAAQAAGGGAEVGAGGFHGRVAGAVALGQFVDLGAGLGFVGLELLDQRVAEDRGDGGKLFPAAAAHGLHLLVLALCFGALAAGVDHAVAGQRQFGGADGGDAVDVDQVFLLAEGLQAVFGILQLGAQLAEAAVHPVGGGHGHFHGRFQLGFDEAVGHGVGGLGGHARVGHVDLDLDQLALAQRRDADALHEGLGDFIEDLRFGRIDVCFEVFRQGGRHDLAEVEAGQQAADVDQRFGLLARIEFGVGGQVQLLDHALGEGAGLEQFELGLQVFVAGALQAVDLFDGDDVGLLLFDQQGGAGAVDRGEAVGGEGGHHHDDQHQGDDAPFAPPDGLPHLQQVGAVAFQTLGDPAAFGGLGVTVHAWGNSGKWWLGRRQSVCLSHAGQYLGDCRDVVPAVLDGVAGGRPIRRSPDRW
ncbi:hypothetical protein D3C84_552640 [compost metagenome]